MWSSLIVICAFTIDIYNTISWSFVVKCLECKKSCQNLLVGKFLNLFNKQRIM